MTFVGLTKAFDKADRLLEILQSDWVPN